jgi:hypothetical protein
MLKWKNMKKNQPKIYFYIPSNLLISELKLDINLYWSWINAFIKKFPIIRPDNLGECNHIGPYNWTLQTYIYLKAVKFNCELTSSLEINGILISHGDFLPKYIKPRAARYIVEIKPDRALSCLLANFAITQSIHDPVIKSFRRFFINSAPVQYWPQPSIIKRDISRGNKLRNVFYMGKSEQFISGVNQLHNKILKLGMNFIIAPREEWNDYSKADVILAVRPEKSSKNGTVPSNLALNKKPASKLINAWIANVPAILSPDPAYLDIKKNKYDFLEAANVSEIINQLKTLKSNSFLYRKMVINSKKRASQIKPELIAIQWRLIIEKKIIPDYNVWKNSKFKRLSTLFFRVISYPKLIKYILKN